MIVHALLSWKARIGRMIRGDRRARTPMPAPRGPRQEPRFDGFGGRLPHTMMMKMMKMTRRRGVGARTASARAPLR